ncbi:FlgO family outer membrane protein, partial [Desulfobacterales bacterium HSG16]|nr:FlgO family outer membrane protein [Desulfobacterales bacterium HSG16]
AMYYTSITIIIGFSVLALSNFLPSIYFGLFTGLAMLIALIAATFADIDNLESSSTFGRTITEYIGSRLVQKGFDVNEIKLGKSILIKKKEGEFLLSRNSEKMSNAVNAHALFTGTYSVAEDIVYVTARVLNPSDSSILAVYDYKLPLGRNARKMLAPGKDQTPEKGRMPGKPSDYE